jgi:L-iditol 2-dehydrogenase
MIVDAGKMRALVRRGTVELASRELPRPAEGEVLVAVKSAGICRTDVYVADGALAVEEPRVLGHEAAGVVASAHERFAVGTRVAINPVLARDRMLGVDLDGTFAEYACVPASAVHRVPEALSWQAAAMAEPVAAALGVLRAPIDRRGRGAVFGAGRIADLLVRVLETAGFEPQRWEHVEEAPRDLDWVVEARASSLDAMIRALRPGGTLVLKSRPPSPVALDVALAVRREITIAARGWGSFDEAVEWLATGRVRVDDLVGEIFPLERFEDAFEAARAGERRKVFFTMER